MTTATKAPPLVHGPSVAAERLAVSVPGLVAIIRKYRYEFTELAPGGKPGDRGRRRWGLSEAQLSRILDGQARQFAPEPASEPTADDYAAVAPDGVSRLRRRKAK